MKKQTLNKLLFIFILVILVNIAPKVAKADVYGFGVGSSGMTYIRNLSGSLGTPIHTGTQSNPFVPGEVLTFYTDLRCPSNVGDYYSCILSASDYYSIQRSLDQFVIRDFGNLYKNNVYGTSVYTYNSTYTIPSNFTNKDTNPEAYSDVAVISLQMMIAAPSNIGSISNFTPAFNVFYIAAPVTNTTTTGTVTLTVYRNSDGSVFTQNANKVTTVGMAPGTPIHIHWKAIGFNTNIVCYFPNGTKSPIGTSESDYPPQNPFVTTTYNINCSDSGTTTSVTTDSVTLHGPYGVACATVTSVEALSVRGVAYGLNPNPTIADSTSTTGNGTGQICTGVGGNVGSSYYARGFATTSSGVTIYGSNMAYGPLTATAY